MGAAVAGRLTMSARIAHYRAADDQNSAIPTVWPWGGVTVQYSAIDLAVRWSTRDSLFAWTSSKQNWTRSSAHVGRRQTLIASLLQRWIGQSSVTREWIRLSNLRESLIKSNKIVAIGWCVRRVAKTAMTDLRPVPPCGRRTSR